MTKDIITVIMRLFVECAHSTNKRIITVIISFVIAKCHICMQIYIYIYIYAT